MGRAIAAFALTAVLVAAAASPARAVPDERAFVMGMPKAELHVHLEGTMAPDLYLEIARRNHVATPYRTAEQVRERLRDAHDLPSFIRIYEELVGAIRTERDFHDIVLAYCRKARAEGVVHAEMFVDPQLHLERGVPLATIYAGLARARRDARRELGLDISYIVCFLRDRPAGDAARVLEDSRPWLGTLVIGVGLDNPEVAGFPEKFRAVFARARALGLHRTTHCDVGQPDTVAHHWGALDVLGVERIDHGLNVLDDPALVEAVRTRGIGLTGAPTLFYAEVPGRMEYRAGAIRRLLEQGIAITVNSDDPGMKRGLYVGDLMMRVRHAASLSREQVVRLARNSFATAWIGAAERRRYMASLDRYLSVQGVGEPGE